MTFRRFLAITLLTVCCGSTAILGLFLYRLDIDLYRPEIEQELVRQTGLPLTLGKVGLSFRHGPAIAFDALKAGSPQHPVALEAKSIYLRLRILPMLYGQLAFSEILLEEPDIRIVARPPSPSATDQPPADFGSALTSGDMFRSIRIHKGQIRFEDRRRAGAPFVLALEQLNLNIDDLSFSAANTIALDGDLLCNNIRSPLRLRGTMLPDSETAGWRHAAYDLDISVKDLASDLISGYLRRSTRDALIRGRSDIVLHFTGTPATGASFTGQMYGRDFGLHLPGPHDAVIPLGSIKLAGIWHTTASAHRIDAFSMQAGDLELAGQLTLDLSGPLPLIGARLHSPPLALTALERMLPFDPALGRPPIRLAAGRLTLQNIELNGTLDQIAGLEFPTGIRRLALSLDDVTVPFGPQAELSRGGMTLDWDGQTLALNRLQAQLGPLGLAINGRFQPTGTLADGLTLAGEGTATLSATDPPETHPLLPANLDLPYRLQLQPAADSARQLQLQVTLPEALLSLKALWHRPADQAERLTIDIDPLPILAITHLSPRLRPLALNGNLTTHLAVIADRNGWQPTATLLLRDGATPIPGPLPDLHTINGKITIAGRSLHGEQVQAILGSSPIAVDVDIPDLGAPVTSLHVTAPAIWARDLVFSSPTMTVDNVDGVVRISPGRVGLGPIKVTLDGGTDATVYGSVSTPQGNVDLVIHSAYGNIDEVINLWADHAPPEPDATASAGIAVPVPVPVPEPAPVAARPARHGSLLLRISSDHGEIAGMPFSDATAQVTRREDTLIISPIRFRSGPGTALGQVLLVHRDQDAPLLKISGHLDQFDAPVIHQQLLKRKSVISGALTADFYLEGTVGHDFLPTSYGGASLELRDGHLHKVAGLSKILTILNLYPLLTRGDSDLGLPYTKVNGTLALRRGIIRTEDLVLKGNVMNLALVGDHNLVTDRLDTTLEAMPLRSVDRLLTRIPVAGWLLTGENKALIAAHFRLSGPSGDPDVEAIPLESIAAPVIGIFKRLIGLPVKLVTDPGKLLQNR